MRNKDNNERGLIEKMYRKIDDAIMKGVNTGIKAYNWTTGGTKVELANGLLTSAPILECFGVAYGLSLMHTSQNPAQNNPLLYVAYLITPAMIFVSHSNQKKFERMTNLEERALKASMLDFEVETIKDSLKVTGPAQISVGAMIYSNYLLQNGKNGSEMLIPISIGAGLRGLADYIMRANNLPRQKNFLKRGMDNVKNLCKILTIEPAKIPIEN